MEETLDACGTACFEGCNRPTAVLEDFGVPILFVTEVSECKSQARARQDGIRQRSSFIYKILWKFFPGTDDSIDTRSGSLLPSEEKDRERVQSFCYSLISSKVDRRKISLHTWAG